MGPYSHYYLAAKFAPLLQAEGSADYYWGAVVPDIRYLAQMRRDHTHVNQEQLDDWLQRYPHLRLFLLGYQVHCRIDQVDGPALVRRAFPLNLFGRLLRKEFSAQQLTMLVEMEYLNRPTLPVTRWVGAHNEVLDELGITPEQSESYSRAMQAYIDSHSIDTALSAMVELGMIENARLEKYRQAYQVLINKKLVQIVLMMSVRNAKLDHVVLATVK